MNSLPRNCILARAKLHDAITTTHRFANDLTQQRLEEGALPPPHPPKKKRREEAGARRRGSATQLRDRVADSLANELDVRIREHGLLGGGGGGPVSCELGAAMGSVAGNSRSAQQRGARATQWWPKWCDCNFDDAVLL